MVALYGGQETIPGQPDHPVNLQVEQVSTLTQQGFGLSPEASEAEHQRLIAKRAEDAEIARLAEYRELERLAGESYYAEGGKGYGTVPGGPDITYMPGDAPFIAKTLYTGLDPIYGEGGIFEPVTDFVTGEGSARQNLLLYGALAIGALALLKK